MEQNLVELLAPLGVGGILALGMFLVYRKDTKAWGEDLKDQSSVMVTLVKESTQATGELRAAVQALTVMIEQSTGRKP